MRSNSIALFDTVEHPWEELGKAGMRQKVVRRDDAAGTYLGLFALDPMVRSGMHHHLDWSTSYMLAGELWDYVGAVRAGQAGVNPPGAIHDAISYVPTLIVVRMEGPVAYLADDGPTHRLHAGAHHSQFVNDRPDVSPDINVTVDQIAAVPTRDRGVTRRDIIAFEPVSGGRRRMAQLSLVPGASISAHRTSDLTEWYVSAGQIEVNGMKASAGCFVTMEPGSSVEAGSRFGANVIAWANGPAGWADGEKSDLYGF